jgi:heat-inducible transcriptional repressor
MVEAFVQGSDYMDLNERKIKILEAIINDYIATGEPIGSRSIAKKYDLGISSATIRNEMSDLEDMGLIVQPHTSAGRIPSEKGYRLYVDELMKPGELSGEDIKFLKQAINTGMGQIDYLMQQTAKALSMLTSYTTVVTEPKSRVIKVKHIQLVPVDERSLVAVIVTDNKVVKNQIIRSASIPNVNELNELSAVVNSIIANVSLDDINADVLGAVLDKYPNYKDIIIKVFKAIVAAVREEEEVHLYTSGVKNILGFPEFSDVNKARNVFQAFEEKDMLINLMSPESVGEQGNDSNQIQILIGGESRVEEMKDCSIVRANYRYGDNSYGTIGIIGPTRMNYSQAVAVLTNIVNNINGVIKSLTDDDNTEGGYYG